MKMLTLALLFYAGCLRGTVVRSGFLFLESGFCSLGSCFAEGLLNSGVCGLVAKFCWFCGRI